MTDAIDVEAVMRLLEQGRADEARGLLDRGTPEAPPPANGSGALAAMLESVLSGSGRPPAGIVATLKDHAPGDVEAAAALSLNHVLMASASLRSGRVAELVDHADAAASSAPPAFPWIVFRAGSLLQAAYRFTGDARLRGRALEVCGRVADRTDLPHLAVQARALMGNIHMLHGAFHRALEHCDAALALADATGTADGPAVAMAHQFRGYILLEWNRLEQAEPALQRAWQLAGDPGHGVRSGVARVLASLCSARGDRRGAERWLRSLEAVMAEPLTLRNREWLAAVRARITLGPGDLRAVDEWLRTWAYSSAANAPAATDVLARLQEYDNVLALLEATRQWHPILELAPRIADAAAEERCWFAARAAATEAVALDALGHTGRAEARMLDALRLGERGSFVRACTEGNPIRLHLLKRVAHSDDGSAARRVLVASENGGRRSAAGLTATQREVLRRVAAGASNKVIAREMGITMSTVKTHLRAVFERLNATSRTQAVARARELDLIDR